MPTIPIQTIKPGFFWPSWAVALAGATNRIEARQITIIANQEAIKMDAAAILAQVKANTDVLSSVAIAADALNENQTSIAAQIADLKAQIAAGQSPDLSAIEQALAEQAQVIDGLKSAVGANTDQA